MRSGAPNLALIDPQNPHRKLASQSGIHEQGLLCAECDSQIGILDKYAYAVLPENPEESKIYPLPRLKKAYIYNMGNIDTQKFLQFIVSLLWRAGISKNQFFEWVKLGPYEKRLREYLLSDISIPKPEIGVIVFLFKPPEFERIMFHPNKCKILGLNFLIFYLYPWKLVIKLDRRPFEYPFKDIQLVVGRDGIAIVQNHFTKGEAKYLAELRLKLLKGGSLQY
jgi:hypothetical protein